MFYYFFLAFCGLLPLQFALNPAPGVDLAVARVAILAFFVWLVAIYAKKRTLPFKKNASTILLAALLFLASFSLLYSHNFLWSARKILFWFSIFPIYAVATFLLDSEEKRKKAITSLVLGGALVAILGIIQFCLQFIVGIDPLYAFLSRYTAPFFLGGTFSSSVLSYPSWLVNSQGTTYMRAFGTFPDPHMFSYYMGMLLPWSVALWATSSSRKKLFLFSSLFLVLADVATFTRGGYVAIIAAAIIILPSIPKEASKKILTGAALFAVLFAFVPHNPVAGRLESSFDIHEGSNQGRLSNWQQALVVIKEHPLGVGIGMYPLTIKPTADYREPIYAHNAYLDIAAELGIPAMLVFIALLLVSMRMFWNKAKTDTFYAAGVASMVVFSVHSLVENPLYSVHVLPLLLIIIALGAKNEPHVEKF